MFQHIGSLKSLKGLINALKKNYQTRFSTAAAKNDNYTLYMIDQSFAEK